MSLVSLFNPEPAATVGRYVLRLSRFGECAMHAVARGVKSAVAAGSGLNNRN
jgi:hypothetical protein